MKKNNILEFSKRFYPEIHDALFRTEKIVEDDYTQSKTALDLGIELIFSHSTREKIQELGGFAKLNESDFIITPYDRVLVDLNEGRRIFVFGISGAGKTFMIARWILDLHLKGIKVFALFDPHDDFIRKISLLLDNRRYVNEIYLPKQIKVRRLIPGFLDVKYEEKDTTNLKIFNNQFFLNYYDLTINDIIRIFKINELSQDVITFFQMVSNYLKTIDVEKIRNAIIHNFNELKEKIGEFYVPSKNQIKSLLARINEQEVSSKMGFFTTLKKISISDIVNEKDTIDIFVTPDVMTYSEIYDVYLRVILYKIREHLQKYSKSSTTKIATIIDEGTNIFKAKNVKNPLLFTKLETLQNIRETRKFGETIIVASQDVYGNIDFEVVKNFEIFVFPLNARIDDVKRLTGNILGIKAVEEFDPYFYAMQSNFGGKEGNYKIASLLKLNGIKTNEFVYAGQSVWAAIFAREGEVKFFVPSFKIQFNPNEYFS